MRDDIAGLGGTLGTAFIERLLTVQPAGSGGWPFALARFQLASYVPELFPQHGIAFPENIRNSVARRQAEFLAGRVCAKAILENYGHARHAIGIGSHRQPVWPSGLIGSITHSAQYAAALACPASALMGVGIDIETIVREEGRAAMIDLVVSPEEVDYLHRCGAGLDFDCLLTLVFSAKESFFKAAFAQVQAFFDFDALQLLHIDPARRLLRFRCQQALSSQLVVGREVVAGFGFIDSGSVFTVILLDHAPGTVNIDSYFKAGNRV